MLDRFRLGPIAGGVSIMNEIAGIIVPFFGVVLLGFGAGRLRFVLPEGLGALNFFVFYLAMPALFFQLVAATPLSDFQGLSFVLTTTFATYCAFAIAFSLAALLNGGKVAEATIQGLVGSYSNVAYMAPALTIAAFGTAAAMPTALIFSFDTALILTLTPLMMALGGTIRVSPMLLAERIGRQVFMHPLILATLAGFLAAAIGLKMPGPIDQLLTILRLAAAPCALFILGVGLSQRSLDHIPFDMPLLVGIKLFVHPLIVYLLLSWVGGYDRIWVYVAVLMAALPPASQVVSIARGYGAYADRVSGAIALAMIASISTLTLILILLLNEILPLDLFR